MAYTLQKFCRDTSDHLKSGAGKAELEKVKSSMEQLLKDEAFVKQQFQDNAEVGLRRIYADPDLGFEVLAYRWDKARASQPHDHGDSWAIYGQIYEYTEMVEYERTDDGSDPGHATLRARRHHKSRSGNRAANLAFVKQFAAANKCKGRGGVFKAVAAGPLPLASLPWQVAQ